MSGDPTFTHHPVMMREINDVFAPVPPGVLVDCTLGGAGHADALLRAHPHLRLLGIDQDGRAIAAAESRLVVHGDDRITVRRARFDQLAAVVAECVDGEVVGVLFDLGVSSPQLDEPERGFSFRSPGPLDMRMDVRQERSAATIVNEYGVEQLARVLAVYGDERFADRIARAIVAARPVATTDELADIVRAAIPAAARRTGRHPAIRTFQAIRIEVNDELEVLERALIQAIDVLAPSGRLAVLAYHSGEDRIVKARLRNAATGGCSCPPALPCGCGARPTMRLLTQGARTPSKVEIEANPRAASARLRSAEKLVLAA
jgi:16S rRNA (cytosine1402-N4)-methyltransferase